MVWGSPVKMLLNASNLHVGGGVQVATSAIQELTLMSNLPPELVIWASDAVDINLRKIGCNLDVLPKYEVVNACGIKLLLSKLSFRIARFDVVLTIFGPLYVLKAPQKNIVGFAQPWIIFPNNEVFRSLTLCGRISSSVKFFIQKIFFKMADQLVVELDHVKKGLSRAGIGQANRVHIVNNCLSSLYLSSQSWQPLSIPAFDCDIKLGYLGRNYPHKNTKLVPEIISILKQQYHIKAVFYVTFTDDEWNACSDEFKSVSANVGPLSVAQCPTFYLCLDAVIFPSLLECFSATPLEAMAMEKPLFVSDRPFNHDVCSEHAYYFDPSNPKDAASKIAAIIKNGGPPKDKLVAARDFALSFANAHDRAKKYLELMLDAAKGA